jgi:hypothetical protein
MKGLWKDMSYLERLAFLVHLNDSIKSMAFDKIGQSRPQLGHVGRVVGICEHCGGYLEYIESGELYCVWNTKRLLNINCQHVSTMLDL